MTIGLTGTGFENYTRRARRWRRELWVEHAFGVVDRLWYVAIGWVSATKFLGGTDAGYVTLFVELGIAACVFHFLHGVARSWARG